VFGTNVLIADMRLLTSRQGNRGSAGNLTAKSRATRLYHADFYSSACGQLLLVEKPDSCKIISESGMKRITPKRVTLFIGVMTVIAVVIYLPRYAREQRQAQATLRQQRMTAQQQAQIAQQQERAAENAAAARLAEQKAAAGRAQFMARYLNPGFAKKPGVKNVAVVAATADGEPDRPIAVALVNQLKDEPLALFTSFFKPAFFADGLFSSIFAGSLESVDQLELTNALDALLLAQERVQYSTNGVALDYVITAHARLEVAFFPLDMMRREQSWTFAADGAGFSPGEARKNAEERLLKQIAGATNMALVAIPSNDQESY
jgi:hypothetical protein